MRGPEASDTFQPVTRGVASCEYTCRPVPGEGGDGAGHAGVLQSLLHAQAIEGVAIDTGKVRARYAHSKLRGELGAVSMGPVLTQRTLSKTRQPAMGYACISNRDTAPIVDECQ